MNMVWHDYGASWRPDRIGCHAVEFTKNVPGDLRRRQSVPAELGAESEEVLCASL